MKNYYQIEYLPITLTSVIKEKILNNNYEYRAKNNFIKCIGIIYHYQLSSYNIEGYVALGSSYWKKVFGGNYKLKIINPLLEFDILQQYDFGFRKNFVGIRYRINPNLITRDHVVIEYLNKGNSNIVTSDDEIYNYGNRFDINFISNTIIRLDNVKVKKWVKDNAEEIFTENLNLEYIKDLPDEYIIEYIDEVESKDIYDNTHYSYNKKHSSIKAIKTVGNQLNKRLIFYNGKFYLVNLPKFKEQKIENIIFHYNREISKITSLPLVEKRSPTTLRIYSNLVNLPSRLLPFILINNNSIVQIDLKTSQFLLFANILNVYLKSGASKLLSLFSSKETQKLLKRLIKILDKIKDKLPNIGVDVNYEYSGKYSNHDLIRFIRDVFFDDFYEIIKKELGFSNRGLAKQIMFQLIFKRDTKPNILIKKILERYPTVIAIINEYKKEIYKINKFDEYNNFSVLLQRIEAEIFIDKILYPIRKKGVPIFTRHDSVIIKEERGEQILNHIKTVFDDLNFKFNFKYEEMFWVSAEQDELEESGYLDWLSGEDLLNGENLPPETLYNDESRSTTKINETNTDSNLNQINEEDTDVINRLLEIGLQDDYCDFINLDFLAEISQLSFLSEDERNLFYEDDMNVRDGMSHFQEQTNEIIRNIIKNFN